MTAVRTARYERLSALLASCSDFELAELIGTGRVNSVGVGGESGVVDVDSVPVFTKRIPLTDREVANPSSTANLFDLPLFCQYGMGGVLPGRSPVADERADIDTVVAAQGGSPAVRARLEALAAATCSLVLFCEYIPHPIEDWLRENPACKAATVERQLSEIVTFLRDRELLRSSSRRQVRAGSRLRRPSVARRPVRAQRRTELCTHGRLCRRHWAKSKSRKHRSPTSRPVASRRNRRHACRTFQRSRAQRPTARIAAMWPARSRRDRSAAPSFHCCWAACCADAASPCHADPKAVTDDCPEASVRSSLE